MEDVPHLSDTHLKELGFSIGARARLRKFQSSQAASVDQQLAGVRQELRELHQAVI